METSKEKAMTNQAMISEMLNRLADQHDQMATCFRVIEALDDAGDCDLYDQRLTGKRLLSQMLDLIERMDQINA
jgi:hypothetical protein